LPSPAELAAVLSPHAQLFLRVDGACTTKTQGNRITSRSTTSPGACCTTWGRDAATSAYTWRNAHAQACGWVTHGTSSPGRGGTPVATDTHTGRGCNHVAHTSSAAHPDALNQKFDGKGSRHVDDTNGSQLTGAAPRARLGARSAAANAMAAKQRAKLRAIVWGVRVRVHDASIVRPCEFVRSPCAQHRAVPLWCSCIFQPVCMDRCMHAMCRLLTTWLGFAVLALAGATNPFPSLFIECARIAAHPRSC
jgi:hypothetical protein